MTATSVAWPVTPTKRIVCSWCGVELSVRLERLEIGVDEQRLHRRDGAIDQTNRGQPRHAGRLQHTVPVQLVVTSWNSDRDRVGRRFCRGQAFALMRRNSIANRTSVDIACRQSRVPQSALPMYMGRQ